MKNNFTLLLLICFALILSCSKTAVNSSAVNSSTSLWPLKAGNIWIYKDTIFDVNDNITTEYNDSLIILSETSSNNGIVFYTMNDSTGWLGKETSIAVGASNEALYEINNNSSSPFILFSLASADGDLIASDEDDSNPNCIAVDNLYGFHTTYQINGFTCYKNIDDIKDCNGNIIYETIYYVAQGVGIVRIEEYSQSSEENILYLSFSKTLQSYKIN